VKVAQGAPKLETSNKTTKPADKSETLKALLIASNGAVSREVFQRQTALESTHTNGSYYDNQHLEET
jgi:hypothetical protein